MRTANTIRREVREILSEFSQHYPILGTIPIRVSSRMTSSAGSARWKGGEPLEIVLSLPFFADMENDLRRTVVHEAAHILAGKVAGHGYAWRRLDIGMGGDGTRCHTMSLAQGFKRAPRKRAARVSVSCPKCLQPMSLGPTQARKARMGFRYSHGRCPI